MKSLSRPAKPQIAQEAVKKTEAAVEAAPSNAAMQEDIRALRAEDGDAEAQVPSLLATLTAAMPHHDEMAAEFGDLSEVEAHYGPDANAIVAGMGAMGVAYGHHVAFASQNPDAELVRHELTHVFSTTGDESADERLADSPHAVGEVPRIPTERRELRFKRPTEQVDMADLAAAGKSKPEAAKPLTPEKVAAAIAFNNKKWSGSHRSKIREALGAAPPAEGSFTEAEVRQVQAIQIGAGVEAKGCDGMIGDGTMPILLESGLKLDLAAGGKVKPGDVELVFYPGEFEDIDKWKAENERAVAENPAAPYRAIRAPSGTGRIYVKHKNAIVASVDARGGPPMTIKDHSGHTADPTTAGSWKLGAGHAHVTNSWAYSQIAWGAEVRKRPDSDWEFYDAKVKRFKVATGSKSELKSPLGRDAFESHNKGRSTWMLNDFGQESFQIQGTAGQYIHTTPSDEMAMLQGQEPELTTSHGCLHIDPSARVDLSKLGYLAGGVRLTVKNYEAHLLPAEMRGKMEGN